MKIGLIGLPNSGKTTIFNALTRSKAEVTAYANTRGEPNLATVEVVDERVTRLAEMYRPKKTTYASIELIDFSGLSEGSAKGDAFSGEAMELIKRVDALALVIRNYHDGLMGAPTPMRDMEQLEMEMLLSDLMTVEKRLERIAWSYQRGQKSDTLQSEEKTLLKISGHLNANQPIRTLEFNNDEEKSIRTFHFLSKKPQMVILNSQESDFGRNEDLLAEMSRKHKVIEFSGNFEMELSCLEDEAEARMFMEDMGMEASARDRLTQAAYSLLGYISFFTVGPDEVRAWTIRKGDTAVEAAGAIHSDLSKGFIRAECFSYHDLIECGSEKGIREKGRFRLEGKSYIVRDHDILSIRFNV